MLEMNSAFPWSIMKKLDDLYRGYAINDEFQFESYAGK
jgi:hypothetical protein